MIKYKDDRHWTCFIKRQVNLCSDGVVSLSNLKFHATRFYYLQRVLPIHFGLKIFCIQHGRNTILEVILKKKSQSVWNEWISLIDSSSFSVQFTGSYATTAEGTKKDGSKRSRYNVAEKGGGKASFILRCQECLK